MYDDLTCPISIPLNSRPYWKDMENWIGTWTGSKWWWKVLEYSYEKVLESHGKPLSLFCKQ